MIFKSQSQCPSAWLESFGRHQTGRMFACILLFTLGDAYRASFKSQEHFDDLSVKLWTWNSGKAELSQEADRLEADSRGSDVLVTCQTEATVAIKKFMKESEWHLLAHGEHWGAAGGRLNAQMASIFVRRRQGAVLTGNVSELILTRPWRSDVGQTGVLSQGGREVLRAVPQVIATDYKGKGGVAMAASFLRNGKPFRIDFVCAHLDSETKEARSAGIAELLAKDRSYDPQISKMLRKEAVGSKGQIRQPCAIFDRQHPSCPLLEMDLGEGPDAVFIFGDLNYRLAAEGLQDFPHELLMDYVGREFLARQDPLRKNFRGDDMDLYRFQDALVRPAERLGFGFTCDEPFELFPPSYKRKGGQVVVYRKLDWITQSTILAELKNITNEFETLGYTIQNVSGAELSLSKVEQIVEEYDMENFPLLIYAEPHESCEMMGKAMESCGGRKQPACKDSVLDYAEHCYTRRDKQGNDRWATKKDDLQLGWLDRFCFRKTSDIEINIGIQEVEGWLDYPGAKVKKSGSDHMPVAATVLFSSFACHCEGLPPNMLVKGCEEPTKVISGKQMPSASCAEGYALKTKQPEMTLKCFNGKLEPAEPFAVLECVKVCKTDDGSRIVLEGEEIRFDCPAAPVTLGDPVHVCRDGQFHSRGITPFCGRICTLDADMEDVFIKSRQVLDDDHMKLYGPELTPEILAPLSALDVLSTGYFELGCRKQCIAMGDNIQKCLLDTWKPQQQRMECACRVELFLEAVSFKDEEFGSRVNRLKLQLYRGPLTEEKLEEQRNNKGYLDSQKFELSDVGSKVIRLAAEYPADVELHVTVCSHDRDNSPNLNWRRRLFSSCGILAHTIHSKALEELMEGRYSVPRDGLVSRNFDIELLLVDPMKESKPHWITLSFVGRWRR